MKNIILNPIDSLAKWVASGFGSGFAVVAPGTFGSVAALIFWLLQFSLGLLPTSTANFILLGTTVVVGLASVMVCVRDLEFGVDPQWIVIDEWAGLYVALLGLRPSDWPLIVLAFLSFRVFDALKIGPVGWAESLPGAWGIMADDLVAGILSAAIVWCVRWVC
jgi:phosphatidylglycerophosphatase A